MERDYSAASSDVVTLRLIPTFSSCVSSMTSRFIPTLELASVLSVTSRLSPTLSELSVISTSFSSDPHAVTRVSERRNTERRVNFFMIRIEKICIGGTIGNVLLRVNGSQLLIFSCAVLCFLRV